MPEIIKQLQNQLNEAMEKDKNPYIRIEDAARLLGVDVECLRRSIYNGTCPFGVGYSGTKGRNGYAKIPKLTFYNWVTATKRSM